MEHRIDDNHMLKDDTYVVWDLENGKPVQSEVRP